MPHQYGIHGILEDQHHVMTRLREEVSARMPRPDETKALHLRPGVPVLDVWHTSIDQDALWCAMSVFWSGCPASAGARQPTGVAASGCALGSRLSERSRMLPGSVLVLSFSRAYCHGQCSGSAGQH